MGKDLTDGGGDRSVSSIAIILSPVPSGPIALVSGAVFGPLEGTLYIVGGAELGAIVAFLVARLLGYELVRLSARAEPLLERLRQSHSQNWLMAAVYAILPPLPHMRASCPIWSEGRLIRFRTAVRTRYWQVIVLAQRDCRP